jgi:hypothetical protein
MPTATSPVLPDIRSEPASSDEPGRRPPESDRRPAVRWVLWPAMAFLCLGGFGGGVSLITDRSGASLQADLSWLQHTPVHDFFLPGLFILGVYGIGTFLAIAGMVTRRSPGPLSRFDGRLGVHWSLALTVAIGAVLVAWILYEFVIFSDRIWLQPVLLGVGLIMVAVPLMPSMLRWFATPTRR